MRFLVMVVVCFLVTFAGACRTNVTSAPVLEDGFYSVAMIAPSREELRNPQADEALIVETRRFVRGGKANPPNYVLVDTRRFVPLRLSNAPEKSVGADGRERILISLQPDSTQELAEFTRSVADRQGQVVVVIGGEIVTRHKVRAPILGGQLAISC